MLAYCPPTNRSGGRFDPRAFAYASQKKILGPGRFPRPTRSGAIWGCVARKADPLSVTTPTFQESSLLRVVILAAAPRLPVPVRTAQTVSQWQDRSQVPLRYPHRRSSRPRFAVSPSRAHTARMRISDLS